MEKCPPSLTSAGECSLVLHQSVWPAKAHLPTEHGPLGRWVSDEGSSASPGTEQLFLDSWSQQILDSWSQQIQRAGLGWDLRG